MNYQKELSTATQAVQKAGDLIRSMRESSQLERTVKADGSPVSNADTAAEQLLKDELLAAFPDYGFIGEEGTAIRDRKYTWICDPIDGTWAYLNGEKTAVTSLALHSKDEGIVLGIIYNPFTRELYTSAQGLETKVNEQQLPANNPTDLKRAVVNYNIAKTNNTNRDTFCHLYQLWRNNEIGKLVSTGGSLAYQLAQVAEGVQSIYLLQSSKPASCWDIAAGIHLVRSVGGKVTDEEGRDIMEGDMPKTIVATTNKTLHHQFLTALRSVYQM